MLVHVPNAKSKGHIDRNILEPVVALHISESKFEVEFSGIIA
jgi:hypothetical protein